MVGETELEFANS